MKPRTAGYVVAASAALNLLGARLLDRLGLVEGLLSPSGGNLALLVPVATLFYAARFCALFVAPGLLLGAVTVKLLSAGLSRGRSG
jgi:hypothetical protein